MEKSKSEKKKRHSPSVKAIRQSSASAGIRGLKKKRIGADRIDEALEKEAARNVRREARGSTKGSEREDCRNQRREQAQTESSTSFDTALKSTERTELHAGALLAPIPPAIVTVSDGERDNLLAIGWTGILSTIPPRTYISVRPERYSHGILKRHGEFVINLPSADMARAVDFVGIYTGAKIDKFEGSGLRRIPSKSVLPPTVEGCPIALECRVVEVREMGSHDVFIADIVNVTCQNELIDEKGKLHYEKADLLAYAHGEYYRLGERVGRFGFSTDKKSKNAKK